MQIKNGVSKKALVNRLCRIEGQLRGVREMIDQDADCQKIAVQLSACKSAIHQTLGAFAVCALEESAGAPHGSKKIEDISKILKLVS